MTEFEINKEVASRYLPCDYNINDRTKQVELIRFLGDTSEYEIYGTFDPCNDVSQAWEIMLKYNICVTKGDGGRHEAYKNLLIDNDWESSCEVLRFHPKPLVAAMLVFLEI